MSTYDYDDSDNEEETIEPLSEEVLKERQAKKDAFRDTLLAWKKKRIDEVTKDSQDTTILNQYLKEAAELYKKLRDQLEGRVIGDDFDLDTLSGMERADLLSVAYSDLVEFPFTFKKKLIDSFPKTNSLEHAEIIPNLD